MKPNIVLFITHDQGQLLGCYNTPLMPNSLKTPNTDGLAANGIKFTNYFCTTPLCSPSRGSMITSKYPHKNGLMGLVNRGWSLPKTNNLEKDPNEKNNLINNPKYRDIASDLRKRLNNWMKETDDPLLKGKVEHQYNNKKRW